jgi:hypothetical protein
VVPLLHAALAPASSTSTTTTTLTAAARLGTMVAGMLSLRRVLATAVGRAAIGALLTLLHGWDLVGAVLEAVSAHGARLAALRPAALAAAQVLGVGEGVDAVDAQLALVERAVAAVAPLLLVGTDQGLWWAAAASGSGPARLRALVSAWPGKGAVPSPLHSVLRPLLLLDGDASLNDSSSGLLAGTALAPLPLADPLLLAVRACESALARLTDDVPNQSSTKASANVAERAGPTTPPAGTGAGGTSAALLLALGSDRAADAATAATALAAVQELACAVRLLHILVQCAPGGPAGAVAVLASQRPLRLLERALGLAARALRRLDRWRAPAPSPARLWLLAGVAAPSLALLRLILVAGYSGDHAPPATWDRILPPVWDLAHALTGGYAPHAVAHIHPPTRTRTHTSTRTWKGALRKTGMPTHMDMLWTAPDCPRAVPVPGWGVRRVMRRWWRGGPWSAWCRY